MDENIDLFAITKESIMKEEAEIHKLFNDNITDKKIIEKRVAKLLNIFHDITTGYLRFINK